MDALERMLEDEQEVLSFLLREEFIAMTTRIAIPMEDPIIHTAATGYYCSSLTNPDWATCPCRVAAEEHVREWQAEQDETGTHPPDCACSWCIPDEPRYYSRADQEADQATADYYDEAQRRQETRQCSDGSWW